MRRILMSVLAITAMAAIFITLRARSHTQLVVPAPVRSFACSGRVEASSENITIGPTVSGVVTRVLVQEGNAVHAGQVLVKFDCADLEGALQSAIAAADALREQKARIFRGSREEEIGIAKDRVKSTEAVLRESELDRDRTERLYQDGVLAKNAYDAAIRSYEVAAAEAKLAADQLQLAQAGALPEERTKAVDELSSAESKVRQVRGELEKCTVRAPAKGIILKSYVHPGESFSVLEPRPLFLLGDLSEVRVRAEVDEYDVAKVKIGQHVSVWQDSNPEQQYQGVVERSSKAMGRKSILTGDPAEKADRDVLEVIVKLDGEAARTMPVGLRVTVRFD